MYRNGIIQKPASKKLYKAAPRRLTSSPHSVGGDGQPDQSAGARVIIVGSTSLEGRRLSRAIEDERAELVGFASTVDEAESMLDLYKPDVVLLAGDETDGATGVRLDGMKIAVRIASALQGCSVA
jgi:hypothetical protein